MKKWTKIAIALSSVTLTGATAFYLYGNYKALDEIDFFIEGADVKGSSKTGELTLKVKVKLKNPTDFKLKVFNYKFSVTLGDVYLGEVSNENMTEIAKNGYTMIEIPFVVKKTDFDLKHINELLTLINKVIKKEKVLAKITGVVTAGFNKIIKTNVNFDNYEVYVVDLSGENN